MMKINTSAAPSSEFQKNGALNTKERSPPRGRHQNGKRRKTGQPYEREPFLILCLSLLLQEFPVPPKRNSQWLYQDL